MRYYLNHAFQPRTSYTDELRDILSLGAFEQARQVITSWEGYAPTPLYSLSGFASQLGLRSILYKHEADRFGLGSFKALGGAYAVFRLLQRLIGQRLGVPAESITYEQLRAGDYSGIASTITVTTATDGNHGRSVAWGA